MNLNLRSSKRHSENNFSQTAFVLEVLAAFKDQTRKMSIPDEKFIEVTGRSRKKFFDWIENENPRNITLWDLASYADAFGFRFRVSCN